MKNLLLLILFCSIPFLGYTQKKATVKRFFKKYKKYENAAGMTIPGFLIGIGMGFVKEKEIKVFKKLTKRVKQVRFLNIEEKNAVSHKDYKQLLAVLNVNNFEELVAISSEGEQVKLYLKEWKGKIKSIFVIVKGADHFTFVEIKSRIRMKDLNIIINNLMQLGEVSNKVKSKKTKKEESTKAAVSQT